MTCGTAYHPLYRFALFGHHSAFCAEIAAATDDDAYREALRFMGELLKEGDTMRDDGFSYRVTVTAIDGRRICDITSCGANHASRD